MFYGCVHVGDSMGKLVLWRRLVSSLHLSVQWCVSDIFYYLCLCCLEDGWKCKSMTKPYCAPSYCYMWKSSNAYSLHIEYIIISIRYWRPNI